MTATTSAGRHPRAARAVALGAALSVAAAGGALAGAAPAGAATPNAQSVGRFLDGAAGGRPIQALVDLKDARAYAPGHTSQQNPLDATLLGQIAVPVGHALQLPGGGAFHLGAVNQVAHAHVNGASYGASGAVANSGAVSAGGSNGAYPADARIDLSDASLGTVPVPGLPPVPGAAGRSGALKVPAGAQPALGGISADIGAISALARTRPGGAFTAPHYKIASLALVLRSPALAALLKQLEQGGAQLQPVLTQLYDALQVAQLKVPDSCKLSPGAPPATLRLDHGAVVVDPATGSITVNLGALLRTLGVRLNALPPNTDLLAYVLNNLGRILSKGLAGTVNGLINPVKALGQQCPKDIAGEAGAPVDKLVASVLTALSSGQTQLEAALEQVAAQLSSATAPGLAQLTSALAKALRIGVNVQQGAYPLAGAPSPRYRFTSALAPTPDQATRVVAGQGVVRALEIDVAGTQGAALALGNAAAGPASSPPPAPATSPPASPVPSTQIPTAVPAGAAADNGGSGSLPLVALLLVLAVGGGAVACRRRGRFSR